MCSDFGKPPFSGSQSSLLTPWEGLRTQTLELHSLGSNPSCLTTNLLSFLSPFPQVQNRNNNSNYLIGLLIDLNVKHQNGAWCKSNVSEAT